MLGTDYQLLKRGFICATINMYGYDFVIKSRRKSRRHSCRPLYLVPEGELTLVVNTVQHTGDALHTRTLGPMQAFPATTTPVHLTIKNEKNFKAMVRLCQGEAVCLGVTCPSCCVSVPRRRKQSCSLPELYSATLAPWQLRLRVSKRLTELALEGGPLRPPLCLPTVPSSPKDGCGHTCNPGAHLPFHPVFPSTAFKGTEFGQRN